MLQYIANALFVKLCRQPELPNLSRLDNDTILQYKPSDENDINGNATYRLLSAILNLFNVRDKSKNQEYIPTEPFIEAFSIIGEAKTFGYLKSILDAKVNGFNMLPYWISDPNILLVLDSSYQERAAFYGATCFIEKFHKQDLGFDEWMRFVWNIAEHDVDGFESFIRVCNLFDKLSELGGCTDILGTLQNEESETLSATAQYKEERIKALTKSDETLLCLIKTVEKHAFFHGTIRFLFEKESENVWMGFDKKVQNRSLLIPAKKEERETVIKLVPYLSDEKIKKVFNKWNVDNTDNNLRGILLDSEIQSELQQFFKRETSQEEMNEFKKQLIALAPNHPSYYILTDWRGAHGNYKCSLTGTSTQSWYFASKAFPMDDVVYYNIEKILKGAPFEHKNAQGFERDEYLVGLEINFKYRELKFRYYNENHTIRLIGSDYKHIGEATKGSNYFEVSEYDTLQSIIPQMDKMVDYSHRCLLSELKGVYDYLENEGKRPALYGFQEDGKTDVPISFEEIDSYKWVTVGLNCGQFALAVTLDCNHRTEIGLRVLPNETAKNKLNLGKPDSPNRYSSDNHFWYFVYSIPQFKNQSVIDELNILIKQFDNKNI